MELDCRNKCDEVISICSILSTREILSSFVSDQLEAFGSKDHAIAKIQTASLLLKDLQSKLIGLEINCKNEVIGALTRVSILDEDVDDIDQKIQDLIECIKSNS